MYSTWYAGVELAAHLSLCYTRSPTFDVPWSPESLAQAQAKPS